jgi:outer membrane protein assembly factor BamB
MHGFNSYASASPAVDQDHVYLVFTTPQQYTVRALDLEKGREVWQRALGPFVAQHGSGASPILYDGMLICTADKDEDSFVIALDRLTGETRWKVDRRSEKAAYSTPCIYRPEGGQPQLILTSLAHGFTALEPASGQTVWELPIMKYRCVGSPVIAAGLIFATGGEGGIGRQMFAVRPGVPEKGIEAEVAYEVKGSLPYVCTPVAYGDLLFSWFDKGVVTCLDAPTGKVHWQERVGGDFFGSPVRVADRIYCISRKGEMVVLAAADQFKLLGRIDLGADSHSTPVVADGVMYLRTVSHLMAIGGKK